MVEPDFRGWIVSRPANMVAADGSDEISGRIENLVKVPVRIPNDALQALPFRPRSFSAWENDEDVWKYLTRLLDVSMRIIDPNGQEHMVPSKFKPEARQKRIAGARRLLAAFRSPENLLAKAELATKPGGFEPPNHAELGRAIKYYLAWNDTEKELLEESMFFSISHLIEATQELDASVRLAQDSLHKQSLALLRAFLEEVVMPIHFCADPASFREWRKGTYHTPPMRGPKGLLKRLRDQGLINEAVRRKTDELYSELNAAIHAAETLMAVSGIHLGRRDKPGFSLRRLEDWCSYFSRTVDLGLRLLFTSIDQWDRSRPVDPFCNTCHNDSDFAITAELFGSHVYDQVVCKVCDSSIVRPLSLARHKVVTPREFPGFSFRRNASP